MKTLQITLKPGEKIYINGAVIKVDRKVSLSFLNTVVFLLEQHVMKPEEATTPLRQLYFILQAILLDPAPDNIAHAMSRELLGELSGTCRTQALLGGLVEVAGLVERGRYFEALKQVRSLYALEGVILTASELQVAAGGGR